MAGCDPTAGSWSMIILVGERGVQARRSVCLPPGAVRRGPGAVREVVLHRPSSTDQGV